METVRESWTDERLDDLKDQVGDLSRRTEQGFNEIRFEMSNRFDSVEARIDSLQRTMIQFCGVMVAALIALIASQTALAVSLI
jgi:hypothetical protein